MEAKGMHMIMLDKLQCTALQLLMWIYFYVIQKIKNPDYKGKWKAPLIDNPGITFLILKIANINLRVNQLSISPFLLNKKAHAKLFSLCTDYKDDPYIYAFDSLKHIGIELWQVSIVLHEYNEFLFWRATNFHALTRLNQERCSTTF
jgi:hypothetical protein